MRDVHKLKEKYEVSLDTRQVLTFVLLGVVCLGGMFVLGMAVGRKLAAEDKVGPPADLLTQLDQKETELTFQKELTKPMAKEPPPAPAVPAPKVVEAPAPVPAKVVEAPVVAKAVDAPSRPEPAAVKADETVATNVAPHSDAGALREAIARAQRPAEVASDGNWTLQLSAYQDKSEADRFAADLRGKGYAPFVVEAKVNGKGTWYRVRMGRFPSKEAAGRYLSDFRRETQIDAIVTMAN